MRRLLLSISLLWMCHAIASAQTWSLHTDMTRWIAGRACAGFDLAVNDWQTVGLTWQMDIHRDQTEPGVRPWGLQLDYRLWLTRRLFEGLCVGAQVSTRHLPQEALTAGLTGGYGWLLSRHWNLDVACGAGYELRADGARRRHRFTTTYTALNVSYVF